MKPVRIVKTILLSACSFFYMIGCNPSLEKPGRTQYIIDSISSCFIPDQRMGISDIKLRKGGEETIILLGETTNPLLKETIIKTLSNEGNKLIDSIIILPDTLINKKYTGLVTLSVINIRKQPDQRAEMISQGVLGTPVRILKNKENWLLIQTPDQYIGWTEFSSIEPMTISGMAEWKQSERVITLVNSGWVYASKDETGIVGDFVAGSIFTKEANNGAFTKVSFPDGREGYIRSRSVRDFNIWKADVICTEESIVRCASTFFGLPYLWGGSSTKAVDCSGFSQAVYYLNGIILFRDASLQALHGMNVDISQGYGQLKPGDLLFFGTKDNSKLHLTHVAVYKGDSEYIHSSGRVRVNSLDSMHSNYRDSGKNSLLVVKRIINAGDDPGIVQINTHPWY